MPACRIRRSWTEERDLTRPYARPAKLGRKGPPPRVGGGMGVQNDEGQETRRRGGMMSTACSRGGEKAVGLRPTSREEA